MMYLHALYAVMRYIQRVREVTIGIIAPDVYQAFTLIISRVTEPVIATA